MLEESRVKLEPFEEGLAGGRMNRRTEAKKRSDVIIGGRSVLSQFSVISSDFHDFHATRRRHRACQKALKKAVAFPVFGAWSPHRPAEACAGPSPHTPLARPARARKETHAQDVFIAPMLADVFFLFTFRRSRIVSVRDGRDSPRTRYGR